MGHRKWMSCEARQLRCPFEPLSCRAIARKYLHRDVVKWIDEKKNISIHIYYRSIYSLNQNKDKNE
jgi:hypothetical protein